MVFHGGVAVAAAAAIAWWATGHTVLVPAWLAIVAFQAVTLIYAQKTIRLLRRANRELSSAARERYERLMEAFRLGGPRTGPW